MLPVKHRLVKKRDFDKIFKNGKLFNTDQFLVKSDKNNLDISRFGFIVSKKVSNKAVIRNRIKRKIREIIRLNLDKIKPGLDIVLIVKKNMIDKSYWEIEKDIKLFLNINKFL